MTGSNSVSRRWLLVAGVLLLGCGNDSLTRQGGGFGSETTNGIWVSGVAGPNMPVVARNLIGVSGVDSTVADAEGIWAIQLPAGAWAISGQANQLGFLQHLRVDSGDKPLKMNPVVVTSLVAFEGRFTGGNGEAMLAELPGLGREVQVQANGAFRFEGVPQGALVLRARRNGVAAGEFLAFAGKADSFPVGPQTLMLEDFNDGDNFNLMAGFLKNTEWYSWPGLEYGWKTYPALDGSDKVAKLLNDSVGTWRGRSLHVQVIPDSSQPKGSYEAAFKMPLGSQGIGRDSSGEGRVDLSGSDSLVFMMKGKGKMYVTLWAYWGVPESRVDLFSEDLVLSLDWTRVALAWRDLKFRQGSNSTPGAIGSQFDKIRVNRILFRASDVDLWLDDIQIPGASPLLLLR